PRLQAELAADEIELRMLRCLERHLRMFEVGARVHEILVQPLLVELVAEIVVMMDVAPGAVRRVGTLEHPAHTLAPCWGAERDACQRLHNRTEVPSNFEPAGGVRVGETEVGIGHESHQRGTAISGAAVPQLQSHPGGCNRPLQTGGQPSIEYPGWRLNNGRVAVSNLR